MPNVGLCDGLYLATANIVESSDPCDEN